MTPPCKLKNSTCTFREPMSPQWLWCYCKQPAFKPWFLSIQGRGEPFPGLFWPLSPPLSFILLSWRKDSSGSKTAVTTRQFPQVTHVQCWLPDDATQHVWAQGLCTACKTQISGATCHYMTTWPDFSQRERDCRGRERGKAERQCGIVVRVSE